MAKSFLQNNQVARLVRIAENGLLLFFLTCLLALAYGTIPNRWYQVLSVYSGSMQPTFAPGDLIVITRPPSILKPGMVLTLEVDGNLVTHRLVRVNPDGSIVTKGDYNHSPDNWLDTGVKVVGQYRFAIPYLGYLANLRTIFQPSSTGAWFTTSDLVDFSITTSHLSQPKGTSISANLTTLGYYDEALSMYGVGGEICVNNQGDIPTSGLQIQGQIEINQQDGQGFQPTSEPAFHSASIEPILPGDTRCFAFQVPVEYVESALYRLAVSILIDNHSGWLPGGPHCVGPEPCPFGPTVREGFELPVHTDEQEPTPVIIPTPDNTGTPEITLDPTQTLTPTVSPEPSPTEEPTQLEQVDPTITPEPTEPLEPTETPTPEPTIDPILTVPTE
jgi:signal peptidase I